MIRAFMATLGDLASMGVLVGSAVQRTTRARGRGDDRPSHAPDPWESEYAQGGVEPPLEDVLRDPIVHLVMKADRLGPSDVWAALSARRH